MYYTLCIYVYTHCVYIHIYPKEPNMQKWKNIFSYPLFGAVKDNYSTSCQVLMTSTWLKYDEDELQVLDESTIPKTQPARQTELRHRVMRQLDCSGVNPRKSIGGSYAVIKDEVLLQVMRNRSEHMRGQNNRVAWVEVTQFIGVSPIKCQRCMQNIENDM